MTESPTLEEIKAMDWPKVAEIAYKHMAAETHCHADKLKIEQLGTLLEEEEYAPGWEVEFLLYAQRLAYGAVTVMNNTGLRAGDRFTDEDRAAYDPFIFCATFHGPMRKDPETGRVVPTCLYPEVGRGKTSLQAVVRGVVYLACGKGAWNLRRNNHPSSDCWVTWQATKWAMDGMIVIRHDHIPEVRVEWMDVAKVDVSDLDRMIQGERVNAVLKELTESFAVFQLDNGELFVGPATLACEWRAYTWKVIIGKDDKRVAEVTDQDGDPMAYLMPVHENLVEGDRARFASEYTSPGGLQWSKSTHVAEQSVWNSSVEGVFVYQETDGWWTPDAGPFKSPFDAMNHLDP